jgi:hypothetical protein
MLSEETRGGYISKLLWKFRESETLKLDSVRIVQTKYASFARGGRQRLTAWLRVGLPPEPEEN